ncbi:MAG: hypothetical protein IPN70_04865 [Candidatus Moraniibacteriota bacterium]|nr:MAG: hypothetical protein IPN70_04865 [Candidatus Moranbacteria bacterium]
MRKNIFSGFSIGIGLVFFLSGCSLINEPSLNNEAEKDKENSSIREETRISNEEDTLSSSVSKEGEITPIVVGEEKEGNDDKQALPDSFSKGEKRRCSFNNEQGRHILYTDGIIYRTECFSTEEGLNISIFDGEIFYTWNDSRPMGFSIDRECMKDIEKKIFPTFGFGKSETKSKKNYDSPEEIIKSMPNISCEKMNDSINMNRPQDLKFIDQCDSIEDQLKQVEKIQNEYYNLSKDSQIPEGVTLVP